MAVSPSLPLKILLLTTIAECIRPDFTRPTNASLYKQGLYGKLAKLATEIGETSGEGMHGNLPHLIADNLGTQTGEVTFLEFRCQPPKLIDGGYKLCGDGFCRCKNETADCSRHHGMLTFIPRLPAGISRLLFTQNGLAAIRRDNFFQNATGISMLNLGNNNLSYISPGVFRGMVGLEELYLRQNYLTYKTLVPAFQAPRLRLLDLFYNPLGAPPDRLFQNFSLPHLETLCLDTVGMNRFNMLTFRPPPRLGFLDLSFNALSLETLFPGVLPQLSTLLLIENQFIGFPDTCGDSGPFMPNLTWLDLSYNPVTTLPAKNVCLPRLRTFSCVNCFLSNIQSGTFHHHLFPDLKTVLLSGSVYRTIDAIEDFAFNNSVLEIISLTGIDFSKESFHPDCFAGCPNLTALILHSNDFSGVRRHKMHRLLTHRRLFQLIISFCKIGHISAEAFANLPMLTALSLSSNKLTDLPDGVFDKLGRLEYLDLSSNRLSVVREGTFGLALRQRLKLVDFSNNRFQCGCEIRWLQRWLLTQPNIFSYREEICLPEAERRNSNMNMLDVLPYSFSIRRQYTNVVPADRQGPHSCTAYVCDNEQNVTVHSFYIPDQACIWTPSVCKFVIASIILLTLPFALCASLYRYRWHIRLVLYESARGRGNTLPHSQDTQFLYDIFVSYDSDDVGWVYAHLIPELEGKLGLRLCLHQRDFTPGVAVVVNIEGSVQKSRKSLMLFSRNFSQSEWCQFELRLCLTHAMTVGDMLLVILLEDVPPRDLTPAMMAVMKTMTYIEWAESSDAKASFWGRIRLALSEILNQRQKDRQAD